MLATLHLLGSIKYCSKTLSTSTRAQRQIRNLSQYPSASGQYLNYTRYNTPEIPLKFIVGLSIPSINQFHWFFKVKLYQLKTSFFFAKVHFDTILNIIEQPINCGIFHKIKTEI